MTAKGSKTAYRSICLYPVQQVLSKGAADCQARGQLGNSPQPLLHSPTVLGCLRNESVLSQMRSVQQLVRQQGCQVLRNICWVPCKAACMVSGPPNVAWHQWRSLQDSRFACSSCHATGLSRAAQHVSRVTCSVAEGLSQATQQ